MLPPTSRAPFGQLPGPGPRPQLHRLIALIDTDHNGRVTFKEFADFVAARHKHRTEREIDAARGIAPKPAVPLP